MSIESFCREITEIVIFEAHLLDARKDNPNVPEIKKSLDESSKVGWITQEQREYIVNALINKQW